MKFRLHTTASLAVLSLALAGAVHAQQGTDPAPQAGQGSAQQHEAHGAGPCHGQAEGHAGMSHGRGMGMAMMGGMRDHAAMHRGMHGGSQPQDGTWGGTRPQQPAR